MPSHLQMIYGTPNVRVVYYVRTGATTFEQHTFVRCQTHRHPDVYSRHRIDIESVTPTDEPCTFCEGGTIRLLARHRIRIAPRPRPVLVDRLEPFDWFSRASQPPRPLPVNGRWQPNSPPTRRSA